MTSTDALTSTGGHPAWQRFKDRLGSVPWVIWVALAAIVFWWYFGSGYVGYDSLYLLLWGDDVISGQLPDYGAPHAPTPHPLANLVGIVLALFGSQGALLGMQALTIISLAFLAWGAFALGRKTFSWQVGALFALLLVSRPLLVRQTLISSIDVWFLALLVWAILLEAQKPKRGTPVMVMLILAGLLRPEGWVFAGFYALWMMWGTDRREWWKWIALAATGPILWVLTDWVVMGDPLFSQSSTEEAGKRIQEPTGLVGVRRQTPDSLRLLLHKPAFYLGLLGIGISLVLFRSRARLPLMVALLSLVTITLLGLAGLPLADRYFFLEATMLALFAAIALFGWTVFDGNRLIRGGWAVASIVIVAGLLAFSIRDDVSRSKQLGDIANRFDVLQDNLVELTEQPDIAAVVKSCGPVWFHNFKIRPMLMYATKDPYIFSEIKPFVNSRFGVVIRPSSQTPRFTVPDEFALLEANRSWAVWSYCPPEAKALAKRSRGTQ